MSGSRPRVALGALLVTVLCAAALAGGYLGAHAWRLRDRAPAPTAPPTPPAVAGATAAPTLATSSAAPVPVAARVAAALAGPLADPRLGGVVRAYVADAATGAVLLDRDGAALGAPASTAKLVTAAAVLAAYPPTHRLVTRVVAGAAPGAVVLVGGGDSTLSAAPTGTPSVYPGAARIADLAAQLAGRGVTRVEIDASLFTGPAVSPHWADGDAPSSYAAPITALAVDGGRDRPADLVRSADPAGAAGRALARALGLPASAVRVGRAAPGAAQLASVSSPPLTELVAQMLAQSDNVLAECLARLVAVARHAPASFAGAAAAVRAQLRAAGVDVGAGLTDGSGLAASDRVGAAALVAVLRAASAPDQPGLRALLAALPVAGWDGTLADRFGGSPAAGVVRAKTGTLTGVSALAGVAQDRDGRLLAFAVLADGVGPAEAALDRVVAALATCGCR